MTTRVLVLKVKKELEESIRAANFNPEKANECREAGNEHFKAGAFAEAKKAYDEAIIYNPGDAKLYANRAAAFGKLMAFPVSTHSRPPVLPPCSTARGHVGDLRMRSGTATGASSWTPSTSRPTSARPPSSAPPTSTHRPRAPMRRPSASSPTTPSRPRPPPLPVWAAEGEGSGVQEAQAGLRTMMMKNQGNPEEAKKRAMEDPEVMQILSDPGMRLILEQAQDDPKALQEFTFPSPSSPAPPSITRLALLPATSRTPTSPRSLPSSWTRVSSASAEPHSPFPTLPSSPVSTPGPLKVEEMCPESGLRCEALLCVDESVISISPPVSSCHKR